jgi:hypothetical protein
LTARIGQRGKRAGDKSSGAGQPEQENRGTKAGPGHLDSATREDRQDDRDSIGKRGEDDHDSKDRIARTE